MWKTNNRVEFTMIMVWGGGENDENLMWSEKGELWWGEITQKHTLN